MITATDEDRLPPHFAQQVLQLESLLQDQLSMSLLTDLNELYRIGIDYYIRYEPRKAQHFQKKLRHLLSDPQTLTLISARSPDKTRTMRSPQMLSKSKINEEMKKFTNCSQQHVKNILERSEKAIKKKEDLHAIDLNKQEQSLQHRILLKKCRSNQKLMKFATRN